MWMGYGLTNSCKSIMFENVLGAEYAKELVTKPKPKPRSKKQDCNSNTNRAHKLKSSVQDYCVSALWSNIVA